MTSKVYDFELRGHRDSDMDDLVATDQETGAETVVLRTNSSFFAEIIVQALLDGEIDVEFKEFTK